MWSIMYYIKEKPNSKHKKETNKNNIIKRRSWTIGPGYIMDNVCENAPADNI